jgi:hypothetical protein
LIILILYIFGPTIGGFQVFGIGDYYTAKISTASPEDYCDDLTKIGELKAENPNTRYLACEKYFAGQEKLKLFTYILCTFVFL